MMEDATLRTVTARILFESMTPEDRDKLLTSAISAVLTVDENRDIYSKDRRTRFQRIFDDAVAHQASELVREHLKTPEIIDALRQTLAAATIKVIHSPEFVETMAKRIVEGLWSRER